MSNIKHIIRLRKKQREWLEKVIDDPDSSSRVILRARILLDSDTGRYAQPKSIEEIIEQYQTNRMTINRIRDGFLKNGLDVTVNGKKRQSPPVPAKVDRNVERAILRLIKKAPPLGKKKWSLRMIAIMAQAEGIVESISTTRVAQILHKYNISTSRF